MTTSATRSVGRVLFVTHNVPRFAGDAAGSFVLRLAVALRNRGVMVDVLAPGASDLHGADVVEGVPIERVAYAAPTRMTLAYTGTMAEDVRGSWGARFALVGLLANMRRAIRRRVQRAVRDGAPYDVVHAHWWFPSGLSAWSAGAGAALGVPLVITMHGSDVRLAQGTPVSHGVMRRVLRRARVRTAVSSWLARAAMDIVPDTRIDVGPMPVDTRIFAPPREPLVRSGVLFVGRLNAQKGLGDLIDALAQMANADDVLHVVGAGPDASALRERAESAGVAERVRWYGALPQHDIVPMYQAAAVVAIPSREEGLGLVAVEAQLCGAPVVAYDSGGLPDVVTAATGGTLVAPGDIAGLARALDAHTGGTIEERATRMHDVMPARDAMLRQFSPDAVAERYVAWYAAAMTRA